MLFLQLARIARSLALVRAGSSSAARMAMIAITTRSSMRVKAYGVQVLPELFGVRFSMAVFLIRFAHDKKALGRAALDVGHLDDPVGENERIGSSRPKGRWQRSVC